MDAFQSHSENFNVTMVDDSSTQDVTLNLGIEGLKVMTRAGRLSKKIPLEHITRWSKGSDRITMFIRTPVDIEEKSVSFYGQLQTLNTLLDTLTCFALQLVEIMEAREEAEAAAEIRAVAKNGGRRHQKLKNADEVEFWRSPDKAGWLHSQGDVIKTWRKRWFVLKDGFLFRFLDDNVSASSKPRGIVDLSKVGEVGDGRSVTNRANTIKIGRQKGHVVYMAESETDMVEWLSALEAMHSKVIRIIAGVEEEEHAAPKSKASTQTRSSPPVSNAAFLKQVESNFSAAQDSGQQRAAPQAKPEPLFSFAGSANYPGISPAPAAPRFTQRPAQHNGGMAQDTTSGSSVYSDNLGVTYGMGSGTSIGGIAGLGGVRYGSQQQQQHGASPLPATLNISDQSYPDRRTAAGSGFQPYAAPQSAYTDRYHEGHPQQQQLPQQAADGHVFGGHLPDTINITSIIDQPPAQQSTYGLSARDIGGYDAQPMRASAPPQPALQPSHWQSHFTQEGELYYFDPRTGQTAWEVPN